MSRGYQNPPIVEAVCEFRFEPGSPWDLAVPGLVYENIKKDGFPKRKPVRDLQLGVRQSASGLEREERIIDRVRFLRDDEKAFIQVGPHQLGVHRLKPYSSWSEFRPLIKRALSAYSGAADPKGIQRIGLRYINRIEIPKDTVRLEDYFQFYPSVGSKLPENFGPFIVGIEIPYQGSRDMLRVQLASVKSPVPDVSAMILDLDYFLTKPNAVAIPDITDWISTAHDEVERVFEACITDALREIFEEET